MAKSMKKLLSFVIVAVMVLSMIPAVSATETTQQTKTTGYQAPTTTYTAEEWVEIGDGATLITKMTNNGGVNASANKDKVMGIRLTSDITLNTATAGMKYENTLLYVGGYSSTATSTKNHAQTVILDLNGHTLSAENDGPLGRLFGAYRGSSLTITNGIINQRGTFTNYAPSVFFQGDSKLTLDGVKWTLTDSGARANHGGMFYVSTSKQSLTILNSDLTFDGGETGSVLRGGLVNTANSPTITLKNSSFTGGHAVGGTLDDTAYTANGGQFYLTGGTKFTAENCTFTGGVADNDGGHIYEAEGSGKLVITGCTFSGGSGRYGGSIHSESTSTSNKIENCTFTGNRASRGGALHLTGKMLVKDCTITDNYATGHGGGVYFTGNSSVFTLEGGTLDNAADNMGGSVTKYGKGTLTLNDVDITGEAKNGGAMAVCNGTAILNSGSIHDGKGETGAGNVYVNRDGTVAGKNLSYGVFVMNGGSITGGSAQYGGNIRVYQGRAIINGGEITGAESGNDIQVYSSAAAETTGYVEGTTITTVDMYDCLYVFGGKIGSIVAGADRVNFVSGFAAQGGKFSDMEGYLGAHSTIATEANAEGWLAVTHENTDEGNDIEATCTEEGKIQVACDTCTVTTQYNNTYGGSYAYDVPTKPHTAGEPVVENEVANSCTTDGSYDTVTYCTVCNAEVSRVTTTVEAIGHTAGTPVIENEVANSCTADGSYDTVVYCTVCNAEISRETTTVDAAGHTPGEAVTENEVAATCTADGSYDTVVYCTVCNAQISRETITVTALGHTAGEPVIENEVANSCTADGSYDTVTYCTVCNAEISRETTTVDAAGHTPGEAVTENEVAATCTADGSYDTVVYCTVCNAEISRETITVTALGHTAGEPVIENEVANSCTADGSYDTVTYCTVCGTETSRETTTVAAAGHTEVTDDAKAATCTETGLTEGKHCSVCGTVIVAQETVPATGHSYNSAYTDPTFEADGFTTYTCANCGDSYTVTDEGTKLTAVATADGVPYATLQEALTAGGTVILQQNVTATDKLTVPGTATLDLGGYNLTLANVAGNYALIVKDNLTITGKGTVVASGVYGIGIGVTGSLTVESGTFRADRKNDYLIGNWGTTVINGGTFNGIYCCVNNFSGTTSVYGGTFRTQTTDYTGEYPSADLLANSGLTVYGGTFSKNLEDGFIAPNYAFVKGKKVVKLAEALSAGEVILMGNVTMNEKLSVNGYARLNLNGFTLNLADVEGNYALVVNGTLLLNGEGTVNVPGTYGIGIVGSMIVDNSNFVAGAKNDYLIGNWGTTVINGGTFNGIYCCVNNFQGTTDIYDGTFVTKATDCTGAYESADLLADAGITVYGGIYSKPVDAAFCPEGYSPKANDDGTYTIARGVVITKGPEDASVEPTEDAQFKVEADGEGLSYKWQYKSASGNKWYDTKLTGYDTDTLTVKVYGRSGYQYRCVVTDAYGNQVVTNAAVLTVVPPADAVKITANPENVTVSTGESAIFTVAAEGTDVTYQWQYSRNGATWYDTAMEGNQTATLTVEATIGRNGYQYRCVVNDANGFSAVSGVAVLTVGNGSGESDITGPQDQTATGGTAVFTVEAAEGCTYTWQYQRADGTKWFFTTMEGYNTNALTVTVTASRDGYKYRCIIVDSNGNEYVTEAATLHVG